MSYFFYDMETGGLDEKKVSPLSLSAKITDDNFNKMLEFDMFIKPDDGIYRLEAKGMEINKINLVDHDAVAITETQAAYKILGWLTTKYLGIGRPKLVTHNGDLDKRFLKQMFQNANIDFYQCFSKRSLDTAATALFLQTIGIIPQNNSCSLVQLFLHYYPDKSSVLKTAHTANTDAEMTLAVFKAMRQSVKDIYSISQGRQSHDHQS